MDKALIDQYYRIIRSVCTGAIQDEVSLLGCRGKSVEVGVICLGTTVPGVNGKGTIKVEILGTFESETGKIRLRAADPTGERSNRALFEAFSTWVSKEARILTDASVSKTIVNSLGYLNVVQSKDQRLRVNSSIMNYLKGVVPKMFQVRHKRTTWDAVQISY